MYLKHGASACGKQEYTGGLAFLWFTISIYPEGENSYSPIGVRRLRYRENTSGPFVNLSSVAIQAKVPNLHATHPLTLLRTNLGCMVQGMFIYLGSIEVERIQLQNCLENMLHRVLLENKQVHLYDAELGFRAGTVAGNFHAAPIPGDGSEIVVWQPMTSGLLSQKN